MTPHNGVNIIRLLNLPDRVVLNTRIHKKTVLDNAELSSAEKKLVKNDVHEMIWIAAIKYQNTNIPPFETTKELYDEVHIIQAVLKRERPYKKVAEMLQKIIPYPLLLSLEFENRFCLNTALKQINQNDKTKRTISDYQYSGWLEETDDPVTRKFLDSIRFDKLPAKSLKDFYTGLNQQLINYQLAKQTGTFTEKNEKDRDKILKRLNEIDYEIVNLRNTLRKETSFNKKVELNIRITKLNDEKNQIIQSLSNE